MENFGIYTSCLLKHWGSGGRKTNMQWIWLGQEFHFVMRALNNTVPFLNHRQTQTSIIISVWQYYGKDPYRDRPFCSHLWFPQDVMWMVTFSVGKTFFRCPWTHGDFLPCVFPRLCDCLLRPDVFHLFINPDVTCLSFRPSLPCVFTLSAPLSGGRC